MKTIDLKNIDNAYGIEVHDALRAGSAHDFDELKVSTVLKILIDNNNEMVEQMAKINRTVKMAGRLSRKTKKIVTGIVPPSES